MKLCKMKGRHLCHGDDSECHQQQVRGPPLLHMSEKTKWGVGHRLSLSQINRLFVLFACKDT